MDVDPVQDEEARIRTWPSDSESLSHLVLLGCLLQLPMGRFLLEGKFPSHMPVQIWF